MKFFTLLILGLFVLAACTPSVTNTNTNADWGGTDVSQDLQGQGEIPVGTLETGGSEGEDGENIDTGDDNATDDVRDAVDADEVLDERLFVPYTNKAVGYTLQRPDKWHWRHYIRSEIGGQESEIDDYFITDRNPLPGLGAERLGAIVIEVSSKKLSDFADSVGSLSKKSVTAAGIDATRYEGSERIEYHFTREGKTFRLLYSQVQESQDDKEIFEKLVESFSFEVVKEEGN